MALGGFNQIDFNQGDFNGPSAAGLIIPPRPPITISNPLAPPPIQLTNFATLINGQYREAGVMIFRNGLLLTQGLDYTRNGGIVNLVVPPIPGDILSARVFAIGKQLGGPNPHRYIAPWTLRLTGKFDSVSLFYEIVMPPTIQGGVDGKNGLFTWSVQVARAQVFKNGILQTIGQDYCAGPNALVFLPASIPQPGDIITLLGYNSC